MRTLALIGLLAFSFVTGLSRANALEVGEQAPCVVLNNIAPNGSESEHCIRQTNVKGQAKILEFFLSTCSDCAENLPIVSQLAASVAAVATTRLVGLDRSELALRSFVKDNHQLLNFEVALDTNREAKKAWDVVETPTTFVLDANNKVLFRHAGVLSPEDVSTIEHLVGAH